MNLEDAIFVCSDLACSPIAEDSQDAYDNAVRVVAMIEDSVQTHQISTSNATPRGPPQDVGPYKDCYYVASGLTSEVFKSGAVALKVITETHNIEPHNPTREVKILGLLSHPSIIELLGVEKDHEGYPILVFPYLPVSLDMILDSRQPLQQASVEAIFRSVFSGLNYLHEHGIIHRDIKPSSILLSHGLDAETPVSEIQIKLIDFGTAWHPTLSSSSEPASHKILEVGTTCYRAPETLFGNRSYGTSLDLWAAGCTLAECLRFPRKPLFESRSTEEDGNQLGLILSIFKTLGTPTKETWPEAVHFSTPPFEWYQIFPGHSWDELLPGIDGRMKHLATNLVQYESGNRISAAKVQSLI